MATDLAASEHGTGKIWMNSCASCNIRSTMRSLLRNILALRVQRNTDPRGWLSLWAPISPNLNHKSTAFAGSLNSVLTLSGWSLVWLLLKEWGLSGTIVIQESTCHYHFPVHDDFVARCRMTFTTGTGALSGTVTAEPRQGSGRARGRDLPGRAEGGNLPGPLCCAYPAASNRHSDPTITIRYS